MWKLPGNYISHSSAMISTAQLVTFESVWAKVEEDSEGYDVLATSERVCRRYIHQRGETAFGHFLQWRLYLGAVAVTVTYLTGPGSLIARWPSITYLGTTLRIDDVSMLIMCTFRRIQIIPFEEVLFGVKDITLIESWKI